MPTSRRCRSAFTLVELLIVIAIIALLIAMLFPALSAARRQARVVACASNLHQLSLAFRMYVESNQGHYNPVVPYWPTALRPYWDKSLKGNPVDWVLTDGVLRCPEARDKATTSTAGGAFEPWRSNTSTIGYTIGSYGMLGEQQVIPISLLKVGAKGSNLRPVIFDSTTENISPAPTNTYTSGGLSCVATKRHLRVANVAYVDGSVQTYRLPELWGLKWTSTWIAPTLLPRVPW
jgi:prepilin-type N-terminal cleavage/methylation domain-containing protein/prepilin-type processing-associated H-X9-DG protein